MWDTDEEKSSRLSAINYFEFARDMQRDIFRHIPGEGENEGEKLHASPSVYKRRDDAQNAFVESDWKRVPCASRSPITKSPRR